MEKVVWIRLIEELSNKITDFKLQKLIWKKFKNSTSGHGKQWYPHPLYIWIISKLNWYIIHMMRDTKSFLKYANFQLHIYLYIFKFFTNAYMANTFEIMFLNVASFSCIPVQILEWKITLAIWWGKLKWRYNTMISLAASKDWKLKS